LWKSRPVEKRCQIQESIFQLLSRRVHRGNKTDFLSALARSSSQETSTETNWNGKFTVQDIIDLAKNVHSPKCNETVYNILTGEHAAKRYHFKAAEILDITDNMNSSDVVDYFRKKFPGLVDSNYKVDNLKKSYKKEFEKVLLPERTPAGWRIDPDRLHKCLKYVYHWLPDTGEWWKIHGDARTYGKQKSVVVACQSLNNEQALYGISYQSPKDIWPLCFFYHSDSRLNLEVNLGEPGSNQSSWLNNWIEKMKHNDNLVFLTGDSMFLDAMAGGNLDPKSDAKFNIYNYETVLSKGEVDPVSGLRSGLKKTIEREHPDALLPGKLSLLSSYLCICCR
jgi:hypothetical protein